MSEHIQYDFIADNYFAELKEKEIMTERLNLLATMDPFAGKYFSLDYLRRQILKQTDAEITEIDKQIEKEIAVLQDLGKSCFKEKLRQKRFFFFFFDWELAGSKLIITQPILRISSWNLNHVF